MPEQVVVGEGVAGIERESADSMTWPLLVASSFPRAQKGYDEQTNYVEVPAERFLGELISEIAARRHFAVARSVLDARQDLGEWSTLRVNPNGSFL